MAHLKIEQDTLRDTVTINGVVYARASFEDLGAVRPSAGELLQLVPGVHGALTLERLEESAARQLTFDQWWEDHGKHNAAWTAPQAPGEIERRKELMKLAWDVAIADGRRRSDPAPSGTPSDWVDANVSGNPTLMQAMKNFAENSPQDDGGKRE